MYTCWIILILTLISTPNVPICKFQYQSMSDHYANHHLFGHYADHHLFDHYADHYLPDHYANMGLAVKVIRSLKHYSKLSWISKGTLEQKN